MNLGTHGKSHPSAKKSTQAASYSITCPALKDYTNYGPTHVLRCQVEKIDCDCKTDVVCNEGAQVHYNGEVILDDDERDEAYSEGILLLYYNNQKLPVCCDLTFNKAAADSACRQLGYTGTRSSPIQSSHGTSWVIFSTCTESFSCLKSCINFTAIKIDQCDSCKLTCTYDTSYDRIYTSGSQSECMINVDTHVQDSTPWNSLSIGFGSAFGGIVILIMQVIVFVVLIIIFVYCCRLIRMCNLRRRNNGYEQPLDDHR
jgi:hypothetical protein